MTDETRNSGRPEPVLAPEDVVLAIDEIFPERSPVSAPTHGGKNHHRPPDTRHPTYFLYFVNRSDTRKEVTFETGGFASYDGELVETSKAHSRMVIEPRSAVLLEETDSGSFDSTFYYDATITDATGSSYRAMFAVSRYGRRPLDGTEVDPILNRQVRVIRGEAR